jgi:ribosomal protein S18 acetylase RimI-like enzyme
MKGECMKGECVNIQHANQDDLAEILALQKLAYQENAVRYNDINIPPLTETLDEMIEESKSHIFLKAVVDDVIIGSVRGCKKDDCAYAYIERLIVHPNYQNQGIGRKLMTAIEQELNASVYRLVAGHLDDKNISLYSKLGYVIYGEQIQISPNLSYVHMEKSVPCLCKRVGGNIFFS